jgi:squalene-associated FAD-dependent desaturase
LTAGTDMRRVGVIGAGWAGLAAAVELAQAGWQVQLWEMAPIAGGRGRSGVHQALDHGQPNSVELDAGQHILIGAYTESLRLMRALGVDIDAAFWRGPLQLVGPDGQGLRLPTGHPLLAFLRGLAAHAAWPWSARWQLLMRLAKWHHQGFQAEAGQTVSALCRGLPAVVMDELFEPLCVAALNTPAQAADARVFLRVLADGLFAGPGGSDLLIPRRPLGALLPAPALAHLGRHGATVKLAQRVRHIQPLGAGRWAVQGHERAEVDRLVLACSAPEAARLLAAWDPEWAQAAQRLPFEPIVTTWVQAPGVRLPGPMVRLAQGPAQFAFDLQAIGVPWPDGLSFVTSDAGPWLAQGMATLEAAVREQALSLPGARPGSVQIVRSIAERRATFRCTPGLHRPPMQAAGAHGTAWVAGDYIAGPYPSTLEGAVRSGVAAAQHVQNS